MLKTFTLAPESMITAVSVSCMRTGTVHWEIGWVILRILSGFNEANSFTPIATNLKWTFAVASALKMALFTTMRTSCTIFRTASVLCFVSFISTAVTDGRRRFFPMDIGIWMTIDLAGWLRSFRILRTLCFGSQRVNRCRRTCFHLFCIPVWRFLVARNWWGIFQSKVCLP